MIYHVLHELEEFCTRSGGAVAKNVANILLRDPVRSVVCSKADDSWGIDPSRIIEIPELLPYKTIKGRRLIPACIKGPFFRSVFQPLLSRLKPGDIVWCHHQPYFAAALDRVIRSRGAKLFYHVHDPYVPRTAKSAFLSFKPERWIFISEALRKNYLAMFPDWTNTFVVFNGADEGLFYPAPEDERQENSVPVVLYVGRLQAEKGVHVLMDAMRILHERGVKALCRVIGSHFSGDSKPTPYVRSLYKKVPPNVEFADYCPANEIGKEYRSADIVCCPSIWLGAFGNVNIEAMATGIPVVASCVGGIPEIASEGGILLVEPNAPLELADKLQMLIEDRQLRISIGAEGLRSFRRRFTWTAIVQQYKNIVEKVA